MIPLTRAAIRHGSDKYGCHIYTPVYHSLFAELQEAPIRLLEIGVGGYDAPAAGGLSLKMWADYFPYAQITGLDLRPKTLDLSPRVQVFQGSQDDPGVLANLAERRGPFEIVIDDGRHVVSHVIQSFRTLYPLMQPSGFYIVEDAQTSFMPGLGGNAGGTGTIFDVAHRVSLAMHRLEGHVAVEPDLPEVAFGSITQSVAIHRNMVVFRRGPNTMSSNTTLALDQPEVRKILDDIAAEAALNPSSGSYLTRIDMLIWGQRVRSSAAALALEAAERYPTDWHVFGGVEKFRPDGDGPDNGPRRTPFPDAWKHCSGRLAALPWSSAMRHRRSARRLQGLCQLPGRLPARWTAPSACPYLLLQTHDEGGDRLCLGRTARQVHHLHVRLRDGGLQRLHGRDRPARDRHERWCVGPPSRPGAIDDMTACCSWPDANARPLATSPPSTAWAALDQAGAAQSNAAAIGQNRRPRDGRIRFCIVATPFDNGLRTPT